MTPLSIKDEVVNLHGLCGDACVIGDGLSEMRLLSVGDDVGDGEERCGADRNERSR